MIFDDVQRGEYKWYNYSEIEGYTSAALWKVLFLLSISNILTWQTRLMFVSSVVEDRGGGGW